MEIRALTTFRVDFKPIQSKAKKKVLQNSTQAAIYLWRAVRKRIRRSTNKNQVKTLENKLFYWHKGQLEEYRKSPTEWMKGKRSVAPGRGRGGRKRIEPTDTGTYRWNKVSKPGEGPITHPANAPGWKDEWLRDSIVWTVEGNTILIYSNPAPPGKRMSKEGSPARMYPRTLEFGGPLNWRRRIPVGYVVETVRHGYKAEEGKGREIFGKTQNDGAKIWRQELGKNGKFVNAHRAVNKSGKTRRTHKAQYKQPHVALSRRYVTWQGQKTLEPRPFLAPVQEAFFRQYFPQLFNGLIEK